MQKSANRRTFFRLADRLSAKLGLSGRDATLQKETAYFFLAADPREAAAFFFGLTGSSGAAG
jgi:hypothetical protein